MKKQNLKMLALLGISGGLIISGAEAEAATSNYDHQNTYAGRNGCGSNSCSGKTRPETRDDKGVKENKSDEKVNEGKSKSAEKKNKSAFYDSNGVINENGLYTQLNPEGRSIFNSLDPEGKQLALRLSKQYSNKNQAVKEAQKQVQLRKDQTGSRRSVGVTRRSLFR